MTVVLTLGFVALAIVVALALLWPLLRTPGEPERARFDLAIYRDQLAELDRDRERGLIGEAEARAARLEIERRMLRAADGAGPASSARPLRMVLVGTAVAVPLLAGALYLRLGAPDVPDQPFAARPAPEAPPVDIAAMVARLEARLADSPADTEGWLMLGRSKAALGDPEAAAHAYRKALALEPGSVEALAGLAEALVMAGNGVVGPEAEDLLRRLEAAAPDDPRAGYYLAMADQQAGRPKEALARWQKILAQSPSDAPWRGQIEGLIRDNAKAAGLDGDALIAAAPGTAPQAPPAQARPQPEGAPGMAEEAARIAALPPEEQQKRIREMVDGLQARLEADGGDVEGWSRLARARATLGEPEAALAAWDRALALKPDDPALLLGKAEALLGPAAAGSDLPTVTPQAAAVLDQVAALAPDDPEVLWFQGLRALQAGQPAAARAAWERLVARLDPADPGRAAVQQRIDGLPAAAAGG
ncbi:MAG: c-type cytochrome biogenesis protein CcmI [Geminicoccaceae bacterium]